MFQVIGMLPDINVQKRKHIHRPGGVLICRCYDLRISKGIDHEPGISGAEDGKCGFRKLLLKSLIVVKDRVQIGLKGKWRLSGAGILQIHKIKNVVIHTACIVTDTGLYFGRQRVNTDQQLLKGQRLVLRILRQNIIQLINIGLQVPVVVKAHGLCVDIRFHPVIFIGQRWIYKRIFFIQNVLLTCFSF